MAVPRNGGRRRFVQLLGWAGVVAMARGGPALAAAAAKSRAKSMPPRAPSPVAPAPPAGTPEISEEAKALAEVVRRRYGDQLAEGDLPLIARDLDGDLRGAKRLREVKLANADEPDMTFHA